MCVFVAASCVCVYVREADRSLLPHLEHKSCSASACTHVERSDKSNGTFITRRHKQPQRREDDLDTLIFLEVGRLHRHFPTHSNFFATTPTFSQRLPSSFPPLF